MKTVIQLDDDGYFVGTAVADESPLEEGVYLLPANTVETDEPTIPEGHKALWNGSWVFEEIVEPEPEPIPEIDSMLVLRGQRNMRLQETDWWAGSDLTMTLAQIDYRQALRDITKTYTSVDDVVWPREPEQVRY